MDLSRLPFYLQLIHPRNKKFIKQRDIICNNAEKTNISINIFHVQFFFCLLIKRKNDKLGTMCMINAASYILLFLVSGKLNKFKIT